MMIISSIFTIITLRQQFFFQMGVIIFLAFLIFLAVLFERILQKTIWEVIKIIL